MTVTISQLSTPPSRNDPANFRTRADAFLGELPGFVILANSQNVENNAINANVNTQVATAVNAASTAEVHATAAAETSTAVNWVSGTTYATGNVRRSLIDGLPYVRLTDGAGTTDPRNDSSNWTLSLFQYDTGLPLIKPTLLLDPCNSEIADARLVCTRSTTATYWNALGSIQTAPINKLRVDHDPVTGECLGYLVETSATNLLLNSLINGTALTTQSVSVSATQMCISFYGTGTIVLSGAHSATIAGVGASPARTFLAFTPSAGTLTVTVTGDVKYAQLETGVTTPTSFIPTAGTAVTRSADVVLASGQDVVNFYNQKEGTFVTEFLLYQQESTATRWVFSASDFGGSERLGVYVSALGVVNFEVTISGTSQASLTLQSIASEVVRVAVSYKGNQFYASMNGGAVVSDLSGTLPTIDRLTIGGRAGATFQSNGHIGLVKYLPRACTTAQLQALSRI